MGYLETIGANPCLHDQQEGYMEGIDGTVACDHPCCPNYMESIEECNCANLEPEREKGYLGWFLNLAECLEAYPNPRKGFTFNNVETRSVWIYDGAHWRNTTQGNPFHLIYDIDNAGEVKRGYAQSFYYVPNEEDVRGGTITFHFLIDGKDMWVECDVEYLSDIVLIEWNGSDFVSRVRSLDERVAYVEDGKVVDGSGNVVVNPAAIQSGLNASVQYVPQSKDSNEQAQARKNIGAIGVSTVSNGTAILENKGQTIYPYVPASKIPTTNGKSIEQRVADEESRAQSAEEELAENLSILQGNTQSAASELDRRISEEQRRAESAEKGIEEDLRTFVGSAQTVVSNLRSRILEEEERAKSAEKGIEEDLSSLSQDYGDFKNGLPDYIRERIEDVIGDIDINSEDGRVYIWEIESLEVGDGAVLGEVTQEVLDALTQAQVVVLKSIMDGVEALLVGNSKMSSDESLYIVFDMHFANRLVQYHFNFVGTTYSLWSIESPIITDAEWEEVKSFSEDIEQIKDATEKITSIVDEEGYLVSNGERVDMRFTRSLLPVGTEIVESANLNTIEYLKVGKYFCRLNATAKTVKNCPVNVAFSMEVFNPLSPTYDDETTADYTYRVRVLTQYDTGQQYVQFCKTSGTAGNWTYESWYVTPRTLFTLASSKNDGTAALGSATQGIYVDSTGTLKKMTYTLAKSVPSSAVFTDTKVTAVGNHYTPAEDAEAALEATEGEYVTGVKRDAAGHVVGVFSSVMQIDGKSVPEYVSDAISEAIGTALNTPI